MTLNYELYVTSETAEAAEIVAALAKQGIPAGIDLRTAHTGSAFAVVLIDEARYREAYIVRCTVIEGWYDDDCDPEEAEYQARLDMDAVHPSQWC